MILFGFTGDGDQAHRRTGFVFPSHTTPWRRGLSKVSNFRASGYKLPRFCDLAIQYIQTWDHFNISFTA